MQQLEKWMQIQQPVGRDGQRRSLVILQSCTVEIVYSSVSTLCWCFVRTLWVVECKKQEQKCRWVRPRQKMLSATSSSLKNTRPDQLTCGWHFGYSNCPSRKSQVLLIPIVEKTLPKLKSTDLNRETPRTSVLSMPLVSRKPWGFPDLGPYFDNNSVQLF